MEWAAGSGPSGSVHLVWGCCETQRGGVSGSKVQAETWTSPTVRYISKMSVSAIKMLQDQRPSDLIYHYTSAQGLIGIVETKCLWASSMQYSNDRAEFRHAASLICGLLQLRLEMERGPWNDLYGTLLGAIPSFSGFHINVGSFSEEGDLLSQWRGYCPKGIGFSLGFDPEIIERQAKKQGFKLMKCEYDPRVQREICDEIIAEACRLGNCETDSTARENAALDGFIPNFLQLAPTLKNVSFKEEKEWRIIGGPFSPNHPRISFRAGTSSVIPYYSFCLADETEPLPLKDVLVGPNPEPSLAKSSLEYLLKSRNVDCDLIRESPGTYRSW
jgi:hypothetical protein